jgi:hypothetical protein
MACEMTGVGVPTALIDHHVNLIAGNTSSALAKAGSDSA